MYVCIYIYIYTCTPIYTCTMYIYIYTYTLAAEFNMVVSYGPPKNTNLALALVAALAVGGTSSCTTRPCRRTSVPTTWGRLIRNVGRYTSRVNHVQRYTSPPSEKTIQRIHKT